MHSELILSSAKKVLNTNSDNLALWGATNLQIAINWQYTSIHLILDCKITILAFLGPKKRQIGYFWAKNRQKKSMAQNA